MDLNNENSASYNRYDFAMNLMVILRVDTVDSAALLKYLLVMRAHRRVTIRSDERLLTPTTRPIFST